MNRKTFCQLIVGNNIKEELFNVHTRGWSSNVKNENQTPLTQIKYITYGRGPYKDVIQILCVHMIETDRLVKCGGK